jgi:hypothetical protein
MIFRSRRIVRVVKCKRLVRVGYKAAVGKGMTVQGCVQWYALFSTMLKLLVPLENGKD